GVGRRLRVGRTPDDLLPVRREPGTTVLAYPVGDALLVAAIRVHGIQVDVAVHRAGEDELLPVIGNGGLGVVRAVAGKLSQLSSVEPGGVDLEVSKRPDISLGFVRRRGTGLVMLEGAAVKD